jgi:hypothetical protein
LGSSNHLDAVTLVVGGKVALDCGILFLREIFGGEEPKFFLTKFGDYLLPMYQDVVLREAVLREKVTDLTLPLLGNPWERIPRLLGSGSQDFLGKPAS